MELTEIIVYALEIFIVTTIILIISVYLVYRLKKKSREELCKSYLIMQKKCDKLERLSSFRRRNISRSK